MSSDNQFTALGPTEIGFQANGSNVEIGASIAGNEFGIEGSVGGGRVHVIGTLSPDVKDSGKGTGVGVLGAWPMRQLLLGLCVFAVGCSADAMRSPTSPSSTMDRTAQTQAQAAQPEPAALQAKAAQAQAQTGVPFRGSYEQTETGELQSPTTLLVTGTAEGTATQLGRYTMTFSALVDLTAPSGLGHGIFVAANGDRLFSTGSGRATPTSVPGELSIADTSTITGGTGRFEGATGSFSGVRLLNTATGTSVGSFDGTINLVH